MLRFFRRIRQRLLAGNRFSKYLLYAVGEILLVVVGILIAIQVDNWNEDRKKRLELSRLLLDIEQDLLHNYQIAGATLGFYRTQDSIAKRIAKNQLTKEDYLNNPRLNYYISNWEYYLPAEKNIDQFVESEKMAPARYKQVIGALKGIQGYSAVLDDTWSGLAENLDENTNFLTSFNWFVKNDSLSNAKRHEFFLHDAQYQTAALRYWVYTQNYYDKISRYRAQTMAALATVKILNEDYSAGQVGALFERLGMSAFVPFPCGVGRDQLNSLKDIRSSELYGNLTRNPLYLSLTNNKGQPVTEFSIPPNTLMTLPGTEYFGIEGDNNTLVLVKDPAGRCIGTYGAVENGFLLIAD